MSRKLSAALVGLSFGASFAPIWRDHPDVREVGVCDLRSSLAAETAREYGISKIYASLEDILKDDEVDIVHLVTPIPDHARQTLQVLKAGKHCACTVPMATSLEDIRHIVEAVRVSGKNYMMMETTLYTYPFLYIRSLVEKEELGRIQLLRGSHYQDMEYWPDYWAGLPPFWYGTHAIAPLVALGGRIERVSCLGSGSMREELVRRYGNPYPVETAHFRFANGLAGEATRSLFETARIYQEGLFVYGSRKSVEWGFADSDLPVVSELQERGDSPWRGNPVRTHVQEMPNFYHRLPEPLWPYTVGSSLYDPTNPQLSLQKGAGAGHHGSHAHLVNEFVRSILEERKPEVDEIMAGHITAAGICAHESAMRDGEWLTVPRF